MDLCVYFYLIRLIYTPEYVFLVPTVGDSYKQRSWRNLTAKKYRNKVGMKPILQDFTFFQTSLIRFSSNI